MVKPNFKTLLASFVVLSAWSSSLAAPAQQSSAVQTRLFTCGTGKAQFVNVLVSRDGIHKNFLMVASLSSTAGQGLSASQAGLYIDGISSGINVHSSISYRVKPTNNAGLSALNCSQGPLLRDDGSASYGSFKAVNSPVSQSTVSGPDSSGFYTVTYTGNPPFSGIGLTLNNLGLVATNGGSYLVTDFAIDGQIIPINVHSSQLSCPFGDDQTGITFNEYCGP
ncbi:MAG TPA: hypothetical protein V6C76_14295 [Drouetiella sp.]